MSAAVLGAQEIGARVLRVQDTQRQPNTKSAEHIPNAAPRKGKQIDSTVRKPAITPSQSAHPRPAFIWLMLSPVGQVRLTQLHGITRKFVLHDTMLNQVQKGHVKTGDWIACSVDWTRKQVLSMRCLHRPLRWDGGGDSMRWNQFERTIPATQNQGHHHAITVQGLESAVVYHPSRMNWLHLRARLVRRLREVMHQQGFLEVETPSLTQGPNPEAVSHPIVAEESWLITSPEHHLKRLLCGGFSRVYRLGPVWRGGDLGTLHNPEFTLLEWCEGFANEETLKVRLKQLGASCAPLALEAAQLWQTLGDALVPKASQAQASIQAKIASLQQCARALSQSHTWLELSVAQAFTHYLGITPNWRKGARALYQQVQKAGLPNLQSFAQADFNSLFTALIDLLIGRLPMGCVLLVHWPAQAASLAQLHPQDSSVALRMEWYVNRLELANGFCELTNAREQRQRYQTELIQRQHLGLVQLPLDEAFLTSLEQGMPPAAGMAVGLERLLLALCGADLVEQLLPFAWHER